MRSCLECKWCEVDPEGVAVCRKWLWPNAQDDAILAEDKLRLACAIKTAETCPDFEGESDGE